MSVTSHLHSKTTVSIIGTAGRGKTAFMLQKQHFEAMCHMVEDIITNKWKLDWENIILISGGAAWAVQEFLKQSSTSLVLYLPCKWNENKSQFEDTGKTDWKMNPGKSANKYHSNFSQKLGRNTLQDIQKASTMGATLNCLFHGFHNRNTEVAKSDYLIAFTWSNTDEPDDGGTLDTWKKAKTPNKIHVSLHNILENDKCPTKVKRSSDDTSNVAVKRTKTVAIDFNCYDQEFSELSAEDLHELDAAITTYAESTEVSKKQCKFSPE